ncbi:hypothetical protein ThvES_00007500 [Thiovulum sp. ES]|nr:hypothetical protein ThvES_00007500 [Thiovulum sp. ES]
MSVQEFLENITLEELEELRQKKLEMVGEIPSFSYSKIRFSDLENLVNLQHSLKGLRFKSWFENSLNISKETEEFLERLLVRNADLIKYFDEEDLKVHFLTPLFLKVDFFSLEKEQRDFYNERVTYKTDRFILNGEVDFVFSKGIFKSQTPYFFIQEFKEGKSPSDPEPQLLAELIAGVELNSWKEIKGAYIVGAIWNFVILEKVGENSYQYFVSENFDSTKIEDLKNIYKNLLFIKDEVMKLD